MSDSEVYQDLTDLVEMLSGKRLTVSLVALKEGLQVGATGDCPTASPELEGTIVSWRRLDAMRRAARHVR